MSRTACDVCGANGALWPPKDPDPRWCPSCYDAAMDVRRSLRLRLGEAFSAGDRREADRLQAALLLALRGFIGSARRSTP